MVQAYCLKDKVKIEVTNPRYALNARGAPTVRGTCPKCQGKIYGILSGAEGEKHGLKRRSVPKDG
jgi:hypothetical protein